MTISPIKNTNSSPSLARNIQKKMAETNVETLESSINNSQQPTKVSSNKPPVPSSLLSFSKIRKKHHSEKSVRTTPSLSDVIKDPSPQDNKENSQNSINPSRQAPPLPIQSQYDKYDNRPIGPNKSRASTGYGMELDSSESMFVDENSGKNSNNSNNEADAISVSKSLRDRAVERKARSAGYGRTPFNQSSHTIKSQQTAYSIADPNNSNSDNNHSSPTSYPNHRYHSSTGTHGHHSGGHGHLNKSMSSGLNLRKARTKSGHSFAAEQSVHSSTAIPKYNETIWEKLPDPEASLKSVLTNLSNSLETKREVEAATIAGLSNATLRANEDENNWINTTTSLQLVSRLARYHTSVILPHLQSKIIPLVITFVASIRSKISFHALEAAEELIGKCAKQFTDNQFDLCIKRCYDVVGGNNHFLKEPVDKVIMIAVKNNSPQRVLNSISAVAKGSKSRVVKEYTARAIYESLKFTGPERMLREYRDKVLTMTGFYLTSSDEASRLWGKKIVILLSDASSEFENYVKAANLSPQTASKILESVQQLRENPLSRRVHSGVRSKHASSRQGSSHYRNINGDDNTENSSLESPNMRNSAQYSSRNIYGSASSSRSRLHLSNISAPGTGHGARALHQISADQESVKELTEAMKTGNINDRKRAITRFCDKCMSVKPEDKRFIVDNIAKLADAYLDLIKTSNNKINETALKGLHKCLHPQSSFLQNSDFRDHVPNYVQAIVSHLRVFLFVG